MTDQPEREAPMAEERAKRAALFRCRHVTADVCCKSCVIEEIRLAVATERDSKDRAYDERNRLVAYLAFLFPSCLERHPEEDTEWEDDWRWIVFIHHPQGQLSWHIHDSHLPLFDHVQRGVGNVKWDGHTTKEKYARIAAAIRKRKEAREPTDD